MNKTSRTTPLFLVIAGAASVTSLAGCFFLDSGPDLERHPLHDMAMVIAPPADMAAPADAAMLAVHDMAVAPAVDGGDMAPALLAAPGDEAQKGPVDGISCDVNEMLLFHIHAHLAIYANGAQRLVPAGIGIGPPLQILGDGEVVGGTCYAWLHTHDTSGVIHIESPVQRVFTLGNLFDVWGLTLSANRVGPLLDVVHAYVNGQPFVGDPNTITLDAHNVIQLDVGKVIVAPQPFTFADGL